jgi:hypothetical protein
MPLVLENRGGLTPEIFEPLATTVAGHRNMQAILAWMLGQNPPLRPEDIVGQDEFSFDFVVATQGGIYLSYDTS